MKSFPPESSPEKKREAIKPPRKIIDEVFGEKSYEWYKKNGDSFKESRKQAEKELLKEFRAKFPNTISAFDWDNKDKIEDRIKTFPTEQQLRFRKLVQNFNYSVGLKPYQLHDLASVLAGRLIGSENILAQVTETVKGKKILIIGDDVGSLSETLNLLGAEAYGIEYSPAAVEIAHLGLVSIEGIPQNQVIRGDACDLIEEGSELFAKIHSLGPFDMVFSSGVLNTGSGFDDSWVTHQIKNGRDKYSDFIEDYERFYAYVDELLSKNGLQLHLSVEDKYRPFSDRLPEVKETIQRKDIPDKEAILEEIDGLQKNTTYDRYEMMAPSGTMRFLKILGILSS